jgi:hypothetical protein
MEDFVDWLSSLARGDKSPGEYDRHIRDLDDMRRRLGDLEKAFEDAKGPKRRDPIQDRIDDLKRKIRGHEKEIEQKWPDGRPK